MKAKLDIMSRWKEHDPANRGGGGRRDQMKWSQKWSEHFQQTIAKHKIYTNVQKFGVRGFFLRNYNNFILHGHIKLIKSNSKESHLLCYKKNLLNVLLII